MTNLTRLLGVAGVALGLVSLPSTASADPISEDCGAAYMTDSELVQVDFGMRRFKVNQLVGGPGKRVADQSTETTLVRQWDWCTGGAYDANQWLEFQRDDDGHWVVTEIF